MRKFVLLTAGMAALTVSMPATAQVGDILRQGVESIFGGGGNFSTRLNELNNRIQAAYQRNEISQTQASRLRNELNAIAQLEQSYRSDGLSRAERDELQRRLRMVESRLEQARYNRDRRDDRWGDRDDRYDRDDRWEDRDDRWDDDDRRNGRGCPPGLSKKNNGCLPPGQAKKMGDRYDDRYGNVPSQYGSQYRDTQRYIYRYNDGRIYQIDRRTGRIVRVTEARR